MTRAADDAIRHAGGTDRLITCASGASPSGPVHLGNLREFLTVHFVAEEIRRRGVPVRHLHSWDDYDRFRKVPAGVDPSWAEHIGRPLSAVPDPWGCHDSWAEHFKAPLQAALAEMGVEMEEVSQTERYRAGAYREQILTAVRHRDEIEAGAGPLPHQEGRPDPGVEQEAAALADSVADADDDLAADTGSDRPGPVPVQALLPRVRPRHHRGHGVRRRDDRPVLHLLRVRVRRRHQPGHADEGKLVWKVDWPMRWSVEGVDFEPGGVDHATPGSSYTVGKELVKDVYGARAPSFVGYSFVGRRRHGQDVVLARRRADRGRRAARSSRRRSCAGSTCAASPSRPSTSTSAPRWCGSTTSGTRWAARPRTPTRRDAQVLAFERASATAAAGTLPTPTVVVPFRVLSSVADVTAGSAEQISRIVEHVGHAHDSVADLEPRLSKAMTWTAEFVPGRGPHHGAQRRRTSSGSPPWTRTRSCGWPSCSTGCPTTSTSTR